VSIDDEQQTTVVPDTALTEHVALAWSDETMTYSSLTMMIPVICGRSCAGLV
jgi:hypothetical protein